MADAQKAWADIMAGNLPPGARDANSAILSLLMSMKPTDAAVLAVTLPAGSFRQLALESVGRAWVSLDAKAAFAWASQLPAADAQMALLGMIMDPLSPNVDLAKLYLDKLENPVLHNQAVISIAINQAGQGDPAGALAWVSQMTSGDSLQKAVEGIFKAIAEPPAETSVNDQGQTMHLSWNWGKQDLSAAVALLGKITDPTMRASAIGIMAEGWGMTDLNAAVTWAQSLPDADAAARSAALNSLITNMSKNDPADAAAFIKNSPDPSAYMTIAPNITAALAKYDPQAAYAFAQSLPDGATKDQAISNVLVTMGTTNFTSAWSDATALPDGATKDTAMEGLVGVEVQTDPAQAAALMDQFTPGSEAARYGLHNLVPAWTKLDPQAVTQWMNTLSESQGRTIAIVQFVETAGGKDPATSMQWVNSITDDTTRINNVKRVLGKWPATDPTGELNAIQTANITEGQRATLLSSFQTKQSSAK
jgi:hypothetical protein